MALSANVDAGFPSGNIQSGYPYSKLFIVKNGSTVYKGSLVGLEHATGHIVPLDDASDRSFVGVSMQKVVGDGVLTCEVNPLDFVVRNASVTGFAAQTNAWEPVYATADGTMTLTRPADDAQVVAVTQRYQSSGVGDIIVIGGVLNAIMRLAGSDKEEINLGTFNLADFANSQRIEHTLYGHGKIVLLRANPVKVASTSAKAATLTGNINSTAITTGVLALTTAAMAASGTPLEATPTAANEFHDGDELNLVASSVTAFAEGTVKLTAVIQRLP